MNGYRLGMVVVVVVGIVVGVVSLFLVYWLGSWAVRSTGRVHVDLRLGRGSGKA